ncbi:hypothetical protein COU16_02865 [Candidatus Kaiserbacteria bacterium CG10_big_fil_rev_8_21_14_0_10_47_16]|uniref:CxxC-x17-CxxC domain-containing protein n=1 Tax=Candidatus Kaiserbacteria bacterium CG10_big_fil_rev_8_21_14_0_10_47_16 TaxID=1974608 RepID=A0A2H0UDL7_9BACT|nr:MAG: hypothetical protein COU16_02865 [Candidatus Kaiserbacteria bacterium CG10_big_fil_rev_8_21_14_0_10_47_16]
MHQGNWKCSSCGGAITELPFQPRSESGLTCRACYSKQKGGGSGAAPEASGIPETPGAPEVLDIPDHAELAGEPAPAPEDDFDGAVPATNERPKFEGNWTCAGCGGAITSLPFTPRDTSNLKCLDCFKSSKR